jgi:hypothetical protein
VDVGPNGRLAFAGHVKKDDTTELNFVATTDLDGRAPIYFNTGDYLAVKIAQSDDGSLWTVGAENSRVSGNVKSWANYDTLRHYSVGGTLLAHFLPRWGANTAYVTQQVDASGQRTLGAYNSQNQLVATYNAPFWGP